MKFEFRMSIEMLHLFDIIFPILGKVMEWEKISPLVISISHDEFGSQDNVYLQIFFNTIFCRMMLTPVYLNID